MPAAGMPSVASAASVLHQLEAEQLVATAEVLPPGWVVAVHRPHGQISIGPCAALDLSTVEVLVDVRTRHVYAGLNWQRRHLVALLEWTRRERGETSTALARTRRSSPRPSGTLH